MDLSEIRRLIVVAVASDDVLVELLVLKGGNALELIHRIGERASLDLDYSLREDINDVDAIRSRLFSALKKRFAAIDFTVFDEKFEAKPRRLAQGMNSRWGGYTATFKLIETSEYSEPRGESAQTILDGMRRRAVTSDPDQGRTFTIEISKYEYCEGAQRTTVDHYDCYVYTPAMIAAEKLRAICQQMAGQRSNPTPRPRDFYDIHAIVTNDEQCRFDKPLLQSLVTHMFAAKDVPLRIIGEISSQREFHRLGWVAVENSVRGSFKSFNFYFDFVVAEAGKLQSLWIIEPPR